MPLPKPEGVYSERVVSKGISLLGHWGLVLGHPNSPVAWAGWAAIFQAQVCATIPVLAKYFRGKGQDYACEFRIKENTTPGTANTADGTWVVRVAMPPSVEALWVLG